MSAIVDLHAISFSLSLSLSLNTRVSFVFLLRLLDRREEELGMDTTLQWHQGMALGQAMEEFGPSASSLRSPETAETKSSRAVRPPRKEKPPLKCPRCNSSNTKFCYYNNYSLTQPRYFCKACRRYWTEGGSLRNVPVGGGSRKNKKPSSSSSSSAAAAAASISTPKKYPAEYLNLSATTSGIPQQCVPPVEYNYINGHCSNFAPFVPMMSAPSAAAEFLSGFGVQELLRPPQAMSFPMDGVVNVGGYGAGGKLQFPLADEIKPAVVPSSGINVARQLFDENNNRQSDELPPPAGFWTGLMNNNAGGPW